MDHAQIAREELVERYYRRELPPEVEERFEAHFLGCADCRERLAVEQGLRGGARAVAREEAARAVAAAGVLAWWQRRRWGTALLVLLLLVGLAPVGWWLYQGKERALGEAVAWRQRAAAATLEAQQAEQRAREAQEEIERLAAVQAPEVAPSGTGEPLIPDVFLLRTIRGEGDALPVPAGRPITLAAYLDPDPRFTGYRLTITSSETGFRRQRGGLQPNALGALLVTFPADVLTPGAYTFRVEGEREGGGVEAVDVYPFEVVR